MTEQVKKKNTSEEENPNKHNRLIQCAELILPWLIPQELASISLTCKILSQIAKTITLQRSFDASRSYESHPIPFHNLIDDRPYAFFLYTQSQIITSQSPLHRQPWGSSRFASPVAASRCPSSCDCNCDGCDQGSVSGCETLGLEDQEMGIMRECGPSCACGIQCGNRLTQRGISVKLKIARDERKGWGLYADQVIRQGQFVCELLTTQEARSRQEIYDKLTSGGRFSSALLVVREHLPSGKACLRVNIDATRIGNVARFINHSCGCGNLSTVIVRSFGGLLPRLCFFASKDIKEGEELTFSYGEIRVRSNGLQCFCGSPCCFGFLPSEHT
ncbi:hypothetical protein JCGZ_02677 [Jatropha curcas]|uniref:SET domain-containing protein n=1 Tax=Jatropha curcas TaxID=180498 RepID=A0A067KU34_JATCU|nr:hypothetical protein JCGZ_02677 [Jatropha curcas]